MATLIIPCMTAPHHTFQIELEGNPYRFEFMWNTRALSWFMSIRDASGNTVIAGRRIVVGRPLLKRFKDTRLPPGEILAVDTTGRYEEPGETDLGQRVVLAYVESTDLPEGYPRRV